MDDPVGMRGDIGLVYYEIPLETLSTDLEIKTVARFIEYEQHFKIDPQRVGDYDTNSELYKKYTGSNYETTLTPEITRPWPHSSL